MPPTRRDVLRTTAATGVALAAPATVGVTAASGEYATAKASATTLEYDEPWLESVQPALQTGHLDVDPTAMYGMRARHPGETTDVAVFFTWYTTQQGVSREDSHYLDREPFYVFADSETGTIENVVYAGYHWLAARSDDPPLVETDTGTHPTARVASRWHHYQLDAGLWATTDDRSFVPLANLLDVHSPHLAEGSTVWLDLGWREALRVGSVLDPWLMQDADDWWRRDLAGVSFEATRRRLEVRVASTIPRFDVQGTGQSDLVN